MRPIINLHDWYWIVGANGPHLSEDADGHPPHSQVFSSRENDYVELDDPAYVEWRKLHIGMFDLPDGVEPATRIATEAELRGVLLQLGINMKMSD